MREVTLRTRRDLEHFEREVEKYKEVQNLLAKLEEESKVVKIREASYFQQQAVLQVSSSSFPLLSSSLPFARTYINQGYG